MRLNPLKRTGYGQPASAGLTAPGKARNRKGRVRSVTALVAGVALTGAMISGAGLAAASARPAASPGASGTLHFQIMTTSATARTTHFIAYGLFTGGGKDISGNKTDTVDFSGGTFKIRHSPGHGTQSFDPATCLLKINERGSYKLADGTGKYAGISGHGRYHLRILGIFALNSNGKCSQHQAVAWQQIIKAHGPAHL